MIEKVAKELKKIETAHKVKILFAVELGSRVWGMSSSDSDYDIRFVYKYHVDEYLKISQPKDVINFTIEDRDYAGFDLFKYCRLLNSSNPSTIEWLISDIVYYGKQPEELKKAMQNFNPLALYQHYLSMCKQNYLQFIKGGIKPTYKKYLYAMRGLCNAIYVKEFAKIPPIKLQECLEILNSSEKIPGHIYKKLVTIIELKKSGKEKDIVENISTIDEYIEDKLKENNPPEPRKKINLINDLNEFILAELKQKR